MRPENCLARLVRSGAEIMTECERQVPDDAAVTRRRQTEQTEDAPGTSPSSRPPKDPPNPARSRSVAAADATSKSLARKGISVRIREGLPGLFIGTS
jgi:hypothetical protein